MRTYWLESTTKEEYIRQIHQINSDSRIDFVPSPDPDYIATSPRDSVADIISHNGTNRK